MAINTPAQAEKYYLPFFISGKLDLSDIKKELRTQHQFSEDDIKIIAKVLSNAHMRHAQQSGSMSNSYFTLVLGIAIFILGILLTFFLFQKGFIAWISWLVIFAGLLLIAQSVRNISAKR